MTVQRGLERDRIQRLLAAGSWFGGLPADQQDLLLDNAVLREYPSGAVVSKQDSAGQGLIATLSGQVALSKQISPENEFILHLAGPGFWFGEAAILLDRPVLIQAVARTDLQILLLPAGRLNELLSEHPTLYRHLAVLMSERYMLAMKQLAESSLLSREAYLRRRLTDLTALLRADGAQIENTKAVESGIHPDGSIELALSQADLAKMIGVSRQTLNGYLKSLESEKLIEVGFKSLLIPEPEKLARGG